MDIAPTGLALELPRPFYLFRWITGSDHLHFGYFLSPDESIHEAQENMMRLHLTFLRRADVRVLDAGSGLGATALRLAALGRRVTAVCPEPELVDYARSRPVPAAGEVEWVCTRLEDWRPQAPYDLILFQESLQYLDDVEEVLRSAHAWIRPGGRLVVGDQFLNEERPRTEARFHGIERFLASAARAGFRLHTHCDISVAAAPAIDWMLERLADEGPALVDRFAGRRPEIAADVDAMRACGRLEREAFAAGLLSYRVLALDR